MRPQTAHHNIETLRTLDGLVRGTADAGKLSQTETYSLLTLAIKSKIPLLFLEALEREHSELPELQNELRSYRRQYMVILEMMSYAAKVLEEACIDYAVFKTLRPFSFTVSDVDILIFDASAEKAATIFTKNGFEVIDKGYSSVTLRRPNSELKLDLHDSIAVAGFPYMDLGPLSHERIVRQISGVDVVTLRDEAEAVVCCSHAVFKERMFTMQDYYALTRHLTLSNRSKIRSIVNENGVSAAVSVALSLRNELARVFGGMMTPAFELFSPSITNEFLAAYEVARMRNCGVIPHRLSFAAVGLAGFERLVKSKHGAGLIRHLIQLATAREQSRKLLWKLKESIGRDSY